MTIKSASVVVLLVLAAAAVLSLALGAPYLEARLPGGLPLGNALAGLGPCAMVSAAVVLSKRSTVLRVASVASLVGTALWLPVSVALAGNQELNFGNGRGSVWLAYSAVVVAGATCTLLWALAASALAKARRAGAA